MEGRTGIRNYNSGSLDAPTAVKRKPENRLMRCRGNLTFTPPQRKLVDKVNNCRA
jgi:hypothetical protein